MVSFRMSGNPTVYGLLALSAMELAASQKPGSPLAILQQPTKGFNASAVGAARVAVSPQQVSPPLPVTAPQLESTPIAIVNQAVNQAPSFAEPALHSSPTQSNPEIQQAIPVKAIASGTTSFRDLQSHWSQPFVELLATRGIISGYGDGTFQPDRDIQAAHFSMMLRQAKFYRLKVLQRELGIVSSSAPQASPPPLDRNLQAATYPTAESEAALLLRTHDIRTRAQAAVFIYRNLQATMVSQAPATKSLEIHATPISRPWHSPEPTFSESEERQESPGLSDPFQWSKIEPDWVAQG